MRAVAPLGIFGIAVGATAVILERAPQELHLAGLLIVWISATIVSALTIIGSVMDTQRLNWKKMLGERPMQLEVDEANRLAHSIQQ